jgi:hypothetical protein
MQYEFQKSEDSFQINSLTKFLFNRAGFTVLFTNESYPMDLASNGCLALKVIVKNNSSFLRTKMSFNLVDCHNNVIYVTQEGLSREKVYKKAYHEAIRGAFNELENINYVYRGVENENAPQVVNVVDEKPVKLEKAVEKVVQKTEKVKEVEVKVAAPLVEKKIKKVAQVKEEIAMKTSAYSIEGNYTFDKWGACTISKKEDYFSVIGGDENFEFAVIYKTSKPTIFIIKWAAFKQPQLVELDAVGNLNIDSNEAIKVYKRIN